MLFDTFWSLLRKWHPKVFINDRFYKGFHNAFPVFVKYSFLQGFIRFLDSAKSRSVLLINLMLFDTFGSLLRKWHPEVFINDRFYKGFHKAVSICVKY